MMTIATRFVHTGTALVLAATRFSSSITRRKRRSAPRLDTRRSKHDAGAKGVRQHHSDPGGDA